MKTRCFLTALAASLFFACSYAQKDTTTITFRTEEGELVKQNFVDEYDFVFLNKEPLRFMAKWNAVAALPVLNTDWQLLGGGEGFDNIRLEAALEVKVAPSFSVNGLCSVVFAGEKNNLLDNVTVELEPRYYFHQKRRVRQGNSANNLAGTYLGASFNKTTNLFKPSFLAEGEPYRYDNYATTLRIGFQQRIFKSGYIDFNWGLGAETSTLITIENNGQATYKRTWREHFDQRLSLGWAFGSPKVSRRENRSCDLFKCFREENRMFKIDMLNLVRSLSFREQSGKLSVAYEQKLKNSPFSIQIAADLLGRRAKQNYNASQYVLGAVGGGVSLEPRWYYSSKKRIATGKSGNNLNGAFVGLHVGYTASRNLYDYSDVDYIYLRSSLQVIPIWGIQYRIFDRGFFEYRIGIGLSRYTTDTDYRNAEPFIIDPPAFKGFEPAFFSALKIGFAF